MNGGALKSGGVGGCRVQPAGDVFSLSWPGSFFLSSNHINWADADCKYCFYLHKEISPKICLLNLDSLRVVQLFFLETGFLCETLLALLEYSSFQQEQTVRTSAELPSRLPSCQGWDNKRWKGA